MYPILGQHVLDWEEMTKHWYQFILLGLIIATTLTGTVYITQSLVIRIWRKQKSKPKKDVVSRKAVAELYSLAMQTGHRSRPKVVRPSSFSIYLGSFSLPPTPQQLAVLQRSDLVILDPARAGVEDAMEQAGKRQYLARIDMSQTLESESNKDAALAEIAQLVVDVSKVNHFSGLVLVELEKHFSPAYCNKLLDFVDNAGLIVYLETHPPEFLQNEDFLVHPAVVGVVVRNAAILPDGERRDYFDMEKLQPTVRAWVRQACLRPFSALAMEIYDDRVPVSNAVLKRSMQWCGFYSAVTWAGSESSLYNAEINVPPMEPLGAFEWLKDDTVMEVHATWRNNSSIKRSREDVTSEPWDNLLNIFPQTSIFLASVDKPRPTSQVTTASYASTANITCPALAHSAAPSTSNSFHEYKSLGCYPLGVDVSPLAYAEVVQAQLRLLKLKLLHPVDAQKTTNMGILFKKFLDQYLTTTFPEFTMALRAIQDLVSITQAGKLKISVGLSPGFKYGSQTRFWAVLHEEDNHVDVFISRDAQGIASTVLHTYLSSKGLAREQCFEVETAFALWSGDAPAPHELPRRVVQDVDDLTPEERLLFLQQLRLSGLHNDVMNKMQALVKEKLIEGPSQMQLGEMDAVGYLDGRVSAQDLVEARFQWYEDQSARHPGLDATMAFFENVEESMLAMLRGRRDDQLQILAGSLKSILAKNSTDAWGDIAGLAVFCAARKAALEEVYLEVTDRNPLFNDQSDGAGAFAESFALGSRCEAYFDVSPNVFGKLLSDKFRKIYSQKQPPSWINGAPDFATSYGGAQIDVDPDGKPKGIPEFQRFSFLSVFAIPALIDIALLTTTGRGLYLSGFMSFADQNSATIALMISLLLCGATGTWIAVGGSYYLISMAFSAMNVFVLSRLIGGLAFTIIAGVVGFFIFCGVESAPAAVVFFLYLIAFTSYLTLFAALAIFQFPNSSFLSGRAMIIFCLPWLLISPIITLWTGHDTVVYLIVFYIVIVFLILALRHIGSKWVTWYQSLRKTDDSEIRKWYTASKCKGDPKILAAMTDPAALKVGREALLKDVVAETQKGRFKKPTEDKLVHELAESYDATNFLLDWYCRYSDVPRPIPYSSAWNIQTKVALQTLCDNQKGIRLHSAFIHWRQAGDEIGCGILYFLVALLDKWVDMLSGVHLVGLSASLNNQYRVAVGFGLAYYLIGAVLIDVRAQDLHNAVAGIQPVGIETLKELREHREQEIRSRRKMYTRTLVRYLFWHCWSLALSTVFVFILSDSLNGLIMFLAYVGAYTGLLWYQYTKIFSGPDALKPMLIAVCVGLPIGIVVKRIYPHFAFASVIALASATWTAAILCLWTAKLGLPKSYMTGVQKGERYHAHVKPWNDPEWSQAELKATFEKLGSLPDDLRVKVTADGHPGFEVMSILLAYQTEGGLSTAFPDVEELIDITIQAWKTGQIEVELISLARLGPDIRAISRWTDGNMKLVIGVGKGAKVPLDIRSNCRVVAELLLHEVAEGYFQVPHQHAVLAELLVSDVLPQNIKTLLDEETKYEDVLRWAKREMLKQQCLGIECDLQWDHLPKSTREMFFRRCLGESCELSEAEYVWLARTLKLPGVEDLEIHIARCDLALDAAARAMDYAFSEMNTPTNHPVSILDLDEVFHNSIWSYLKMPFSVIYHFMGVFFKFLVIALVAEPEFQREFEYTMKTKPAVIRASCTFIFNGIWTYSRFLQDAGLSFFLFYGRSNVQKLWDECKGTTINTNRCGAVIKSVEGETTAFRRERPLGGFMLYHYKGVHKIEPKEEIVLLTNVCFYTRDGDLVEREEYAKGQVVNAYEYEYPTLQKSSIFKKVGPKIPESRRCVRGPKYLETVVYNIQGLVESGSFMKDGNLISFKLQYRKNAQFYDDLLRGEYIMPHLSCIISWCAPPRRHASKKHHWIPHSKVLEATYVEGTNVYVAKWSYDHKYHPKITTLLNGEPVTTPPMIEHDWLGVLKKPKYTTFVDENPLLYTGSFKSSRIAKAIGLSTQRIAIPTSLSRSILWKGWKKSQHLDGVIVRYLDEKLLRKNEILKPYWRARNRGDLRSARKYIGSHADAIVASADLDEEISSWTPLCFKFSDFLSFGTGGDAVLHTKSQRVGIDTDETLHVFAADNGTWPNEGGGVSACRRDMINNLKSIRWHMLCESANDFGVFKHQTERNVLSLKVIPLWGLDFLTPSHGLFSNRLDSEVDAIRTDASDLDIQREFVPILTALVKGSRALMFSEADLKQATRAIINLNEYFADKRHWGQVWRSEITKEAWRSLWLTQDLPNTKPSAEWLDTELPTLGHLDTAMELWLRYLFVFAIRVPDKMPAVYQTSHHSVSAAYGIICKVKRNCQLQIWDHAIAWRETNMCLSSTLCKLPPFVRNSLLGLMRLSSALILHHADVILPCADFFNPGWEVEIGTCQGTIEHRNSFKRKISPVVNGITDADKFKPVEKILTTKPTVTMLSHLWFCKDLKTAILAADIIVNEWGFKDYQLDVYGSIEKAPIYSNECQELIASKSLRGQVKLCGSSDPMKVLEQTWLFLNSSLSEGLPLALGEAALTGAPVVCTDVGASLRVLSDPDDFSRYSSVVAPNDARALAKAQIKILAMLDEWGKYADDDGPSPVMPFAPTSEDVEKITARMYEKAEYRRKLGMKSRDIIQKSFGGERYLREHEQMLWIGKSQNISQRRIWGELPDDPTEIRAKLQLAAPVQDEVIPRSAAPSLRSPSPYSRPTTPLHDAQRSSARLGEYMRSTSRLSQASTALSDEGSSFSFAPSRSASHAGLTALPGPLDEEQKPLVITTNKLQKPSRPQYNRGRSSQRRSGVASPTPLHKNPMYDFGKRGTWYVKEAEALKPAKRPDMRYRNSDISVIQLDKVGRWLQPMS